MASGHGSCRGVGRPKTLMEHPGFFERAGPFTVASVAAAAGAELAEGTDPNLVLSEVKPLDDAGRDDLSFVDNPKYLPAFAATSAGACLVAPKFVGQAPEGTACLVTPEPYRAFARALLLFYPDALKPKAGLDGGSRVHPRAGI